MLSQETLDRLADRLAKRYSAVEAKALQLVAQRVKAIGRILPSDATRLARIRDIGGDMALFRAYLMEVTDLSAAEVDALFQAAADENQRFARAYYEAQGKPYVPYDDNVPLKRSVAAQEEITLGELDNISRTTVANAGYGDKEDFVPFDVAYQRIVDEAITAVQSGVEDYNSVMRDRLRALAQGGIQTVEYASGHTRRMDSAMRMNLLDGVRAINQAVADQIGAEIGADGYEISAHTTCATDHLPVQGRRFSKAEYDKLQNGLPFKDEKGRSYKAIRRPIGLWNCRHHATPVILGLSKPTYTDDQLDKLREDNEVKIEIGGKEYTAYEASQLMRGVETEIRKAKNEALIFEVSGDTVGANAARRKVRDYTSAYKSISDAANQRMKYARISVPGYR